MTELRPQAIYRIELCSGEIQRWQFLGIDAQQRVWWRDQESGREFDEASLMYAWKILAEDDRPTD